MRTPVRAALTATTAIFLAAGCTASNHRSTSDAGPHASQHRVTDTPETSASTPAATPPTPSRAAASGRLHSLSGMPAPASPTDVYAAARAGRLSSVVAHDPAYVYVPDTISNNVYVISQRTKKVVRVFPGGNEPQHVVPSYDLRTLYVTADRPGSGSLTPIDPRTGRPGRPLPIDDAYNMYFTPDGRYAIVVQEAYRRLAFYDPHTWKLHDILRIPWCEGIDHMDFTADGTKLLVSCEFANRLAVVDVRRHKVLGMVQLRHVADGMPQDVRLAPDGKTFYVADMVANGVYVVDAKTFRVRRFQPTGNGAHGLYFSRDSKRLFVTNRGEGSISVLAANTGTPITKWRIPGGGSPDMGNVSANGKVLWLSGRYNDVVYAISTRTGRLLAKIPVGVGPHGLCVWPLPGRYSLGHTGILR